MGSEKIVKIVAGEDPEILEQIANVYGAVVDAGIYRAQSIKVAEAANVKTLVIFHHDPLHNDDHLDEVGRLAQERFAGAVMAREGMYISIPIRTDAKPLVKV
jgi:hypothetical protein